MATGVRTIDEAIASVMASATTVRDHVAGLAAPQLKSLLGDFQRARSAMDATWFRILTELEGDSVHLSDGARDTVTFVSNHTGESMGAVQRDLDAASKLNKMPEVADQVEERALSAAKARELARLSADVPVQVREDIARRAEHLSVRQVHDQVARANLRHRPAPPPVQQAEAWFTRELVHTKLTAKLPHLDGAILESAVRAAVADLKLSGELTGAEKLGQGLLAVARYYLDHRPNGDTTLRNRFTLFATVDVETLAGQAGSATLGNGAVIDADTARRIACDCSLARVLTDAKGEILDIGQRSRLISRGLFTYLTLHDGGCRWPGCEAPAWACEGHHVIFWDNSGPTDRSNTALLCWYHHHLLHGDHRWSLVMDDQRNIRVMFESRLVGETSPRRRHRSDQRRPSPSAASPPPGVDPPPDVASPPGVTPPPGVASPPGGRADPPGFEQPELLPLAGC